MVKKSPTQFTPQQVWTISAFSIGILLFIMAGWLWWAKIYSNPQNVFWGMINNSLQTHGVEKHIGQKDTGSSNDQIVQLRLGATSGARVQTTLTQQVQGQASSKVVTETIATPTDLYQRYTTIEVPPSPAAKGPKPDFKPVIGVWAKTPLQSGVASNPIAENMYGMVPLALLNAAARSDVLQTARQNKTYTTTYNQAKHGSSHGRPQLQYQVSVSPPALVTMLKKVDDYSGLKQLKNLSTADYKDAPPIKVTMTVDVLSRHLIALSYQSGGRTETYNSFGLQPDVSAPAKSVPSQQIQQQIQKILGR